MENLPTVLGVVFQHMVAIVVAGVLLTLLLCYALQTLADKQELPHSWMAWVPLLQAYPLVKTGGASFGHFVLLILAMVPAALAAAALGPLGAVVMLGYFGWMLVFFVRLFWNTAEGRSLPGWLGLFAMLPGVGLFAYLYIAFHDGAVAPSKVGMLLGAVFFVLPALPQLEEAQRLGEVGRELEGLADSVEEGDETAFARRMRTILETLRPEEGPRSRSAGAPDELEALSDTFECPEGTRERGAAPPEGTERWCERAGVRHGGYASWYTDGGLRETGAYRDGERTGVWTRWFDSGGKQTQAEFAGDRENGLVLTWDELGRLTQSARFREGMPAGG